MSSELDFIASLQLVLTNLYKFGGTFLIGLGTLGSAISLIVFTKRDLRKNPCSVYFVAVNTANLLLIFTSLLSTVLRNGYNVDPGVYNLLFCRCRIYTILLFDVLSPTFLIFASIDRVLITSTNARTRQQSTLRFAYQCIISSTVFWILCHSHALAFTQIIQFAPGYFVCFHQLGTYLTLISYYSLIVKGILIPLSMLVLGLWTVKNVRYISRVAPTHNILASESVPTAATLRSARSKDHQLIQILLVDVSIYLIFSLMPSIILMYQQITQYQSRSTVQTRLDSFLASTASFGAYIPFCISCYTNFLVSKTFRQGVKSVLTCRYFSRH
ncbi:hypothetical protein I4U23_016657 [Adineta vaga]|nr:hypothetical protein I4U23_016657 [Adineta vaga]